MTRRIRVFSHNADPDIWSHTKKRYKRKNKKKKVKTSAQIEAGKEMKRQAMARFRKVIREMK